MRYLVSTLLIFSLFGCSENKPEEKRDLKSIQAGAVLFTKNCSECHPRTGRGHYLQRIPVTLLTRRSQQELMTWIEGRDAHREMPSFTHLSEEERRSLANYLHNEINK